ncbi:hypothetical protein SAMN04489727_0320 [Amycolatopsis tolypomycina]|uniref:Carboxypeptidase regulatory-like domain-containing protein n=1 Tax=Amycolatopsis tolypomycina TaxID=208445 RepID=A0A1H4IAT6_9PSEU|nr:hypothetical protein [Amycolatopsis tolypomycina]SEB30372.1 hypothetical protein SAMN04489727_0320 [Amycolatopsis tolypomycina]
MPGGKATIVGDVAVYGEQGGVKQGVAGTKVVLVSDGHCPVTAERTTDANGHFEFHDGRPGPTTSCTSCRRRAGRSSTRTRP